MSASISFAPFRLDASNAQLWEAERLIPLRPKTFALLRYLAERPGCLVTKNELLDAVWPDTVVTDGAVKVCVQELRKALADTAQTPQFIETVHRRGYRFIAPVQRPDPLSLLPGPPSLETDCVVGRDAELAQLQRAAAQADAGQRQIVFVTGEPGIGKTALVGAVLRRAAPAVVARGQCVEQYGASEAFLPVLEALTRRCRQADGERFVALLRQHAPSWLLQLPGVLPRQEHEALRRGYADVSRVRMLRELVVGVEVLTADRPLILVLEDLHWGDQSTLDLLAALARRHDPARLLVIATYRPLDAVDDAHPLPAMVQELLRHRHAVELPLQRLDPAAVAAYVAVRFPGGELAGTLSPLLHQHTDGNPLFMVSAADHLVRRGLIRSNNGAWALSGSVADVTREVPASLHHTIEAQIDTLTAAERRVLEAASVAGMEFALAALAAAVDETPDLAATHCAAAIRHRVLRSAGLSEWPDGSSGPQYAFTHALYQEAFYQRVSAARRRRLHQRIGECLETGYGARSSEIAAELAMHFERAGDAPRTITYLGQAGETAVRRHAYGDAIARLSTALALLDQQPSGPERDQRELALRVGLGVPLLNTKGFAAAEVEQTYARALELCRRLGETPQLFPVLEGLHSYYAIRGDIPTAYGLAQQMLRVSDATQEPAQRIEAHHTMGCTEFFRADHVAARSHLQTALDLYGVSPRVTAFQHSGHDPKVCCLCHLGLSLWFQGYADQGLQQIEHALRFAEALNHPDSLALARLEAAWLHLLRGEMGRAQALADATLALAQEHGFAYWAAVAAMFRGCAVAVRGNAQQGLEQLRRGCAGAEAIGVGKVQYLAMRADVHARCGRPAEGIDAVVEALAIVERTGERYLEAELLRLKGELLLHDQSTAEQSQPGLTPSNATVAEQCFQHAIDVARRQRAKSLELRAVRSLSRLWRQHGRSAPARRLLAETYGWFGEGFETSDLKAAAALLHDLRDATA